jgi:hypothetical protein
MKLNFLFLWSALLICSTNLSGQQVFNDRISHEILFNRWPAAWIACPDVPSKEYGIFYFRKSFDLSEIPVEFIIHISADNR